MIGTMRVSARADYALRAAIELAAASGSHVTGEQLARAQDIPGRFIETILTQLRRTGLVRCQRGADGGFWLARPASEISLADIIRAVDGQFPGAPGEPQENVTYPGPAEPLRRVWIALRAFGPTVLETLTLADIVSGELWLPGGPRLVPQPTGSSFLRGLVCCSARSDFPGGPPGLTVVHDDVGVIGRAGRGEVEFLGGDVAGAEAPLDFGGGSESRQVPDPGAIQYLLERCGHEDAQLPPVDQLRAQEEHPVKEQHRVRGGRRHRRGHSGVRVEVVDRVLVPPVAVRAKRVEEDPAERVEVEGVVVVGFWRELAAPVALRPGQVEAFCRGADDLSAPGAKDQRELVGQRGLAGGGRPVDGDPQRVRGRDGLDRPGEPVEELAAGAFVHGL